MPASRRGSATQSPPHRAAATGGNPSTTVQSKATNVVMNPVARPTTHVEATAGQSRARVRVRRNRQCPPPIEGLESQFGEARRSLGLPAETPANNSEKRSWLTANEVKVPPVNSRKRKKIQYVGALVADGTTLYQGLYSEVDRPLHNSHGQQVLPPPSTPETSEDLAGPSFSMETATLDFGNHIEQPSPRKSPRKYQSHTVKRQVTAQKWRELLPLLLPQYASLVASRSLIPTTLPNDHRPTRCTTTGCKQSVVLKVACVYRTCQCYTTLLSLRPYIWILGISHIKLYICACRSAAEQLLQYGLFPCAPVRPSLAVSLEELRYVSIWFRNSAPNVTNWTQVLTSVLADYGYPLKDQVRV